MADPNIRIKRSSVPGKRPTVEQLSSGELALNTYDAELFARRERTGIGTDIVRIGAGTTVTNVLYVTKDGSDSNTGKKIGDAKATLKGALEIAEEGTIIKISAGSYIEDNPLVIPRQVSLVGDSLREVTITPQNSNQDLFYVKEGVYVTEMSFRGSVDPGKACFRFDPHTVGFTSQSPYIRNCTNFLSNSIGLKIDGSDVIGKLKSMVTDSFTQYNQGGIGVSITNEGYAQLVSLFTICNDISVYCGSGGACDLTNSNSSFGNYALVADGRGPKKYSGIITSAAAANSDTFVLDLNVPTLNVTNASYDNVTGLTTITVNTAHNFNVGMGVTISGLGFTCASDGGITTVTYPSGNNGYIFEVNAIPSSTSFEVYVGASTLPHTYTTGGTVKINAVRPFDGQVVYFGELFYTIKDVDITSGGSGYTENVSVNFESPSTNWGVPATGVGQVENGQVTNIEIVSSGRGYTYTPTITISGPPGAGSTATGTSVLVPTYYAIRESTPVVSGICTITITENLPYSVGVGTSVPFFKQSRVLASGHSMEYIGTGTNIDSAFPQAGGVPIQENETDMRNGGLVVYTSTDQAGNFRIGDGVVVDQLTGTISGRFYSKSLFSTMTPFILALGGD
jgi:hypothetical protein